MNAMLKIARIYDAGPVPAAAVMDVIRAAERTAAALQDETTRTPRWWPWAKLPSTAEAERVMASCTAAAQHDDLSADEAAFLRILVFHRLYGGPVADRLHDRLGIEAAHLPDAHRRPRLISLTSVRLSRARHGAPADRSCADRTPSDPGKPDVRRAA